MIATTLADLEAIAWKALNSLARHKYMMFGYWAAIWVYENRRSGLKRPSPFHDLVQIAQRQRIGFE